MQSRECFKEDRMITSDSIQRNSKMSASNCPSALPSGKSLETLKEKIRKNGRMQV